MPWGQNGTIRGRTTTVNHVRVDVITKEYPPNVYGGAGVHVVELVKALRQGVEVQVRAFGEVDPEPDTTGYPDLPQLDQANATLRTLGVDVSMAQDVAGADVVHSHTWYANAAGQLAQMLHGVPPS
jgi:starch synthase